MAGTDALQHSGVWAPSPELGLRFCTGAAPIGPFLIPKPPLCVKHRAILPGAGSPGSRSRSLAVEKLQANIYCHGAEGVYSLSPD